MKAKQFNDFCRRLPATSHVVQWGGHDVWKVGGKVFAIGGLRHDGPEDGGAGGSGAPLAVTFKVSEVAFEILKEQPGLRPAPYLASRGLLWIQHYGRPGLSDAELKDYLARSHALVAAGLSKKTRRALGLEPTI